MVRAMMILREVVWTQTIAGLFGEGKGAAAASLGAREALRAAQQFGWRPSSITPDAPVADERYA
jgi:hypothetical protein